MAQRSGYETRSDWRQFVCEIGGHRVRSGSSGLSLEGLHLRVILLRDHYFPTRSPFCGMLPPF